MAAEMEAELRFHLEGRVEDLMQREGLGRADAEAEARRRFGDLSDYRQQVRAIDDTTYSRRARMEMMDSIRREVGQALRTLWRTPAFTGIAFATLALGIGATTAIYTVLDSVVLQPLPYRNADRLVAVVHPANVPGTGESKWGMSSGGYFQFRKASRTLADLGGFRTGSYTLTGKTGDAEQVQVAEVTASVFTTLQARAALGHLITTDDDQPHAPDVVVLSYELWQRRFSGDPSVLGKTIQTSVGPRQVIGVAEPGLSLPMPGPFASRADLASFGVDLWEPLRLNPAGPFYNSHQYTGIGRLKPGVTAEQAQRDLAAITRRLPETVPNAYSADFMRNFNFRVSVTPLRDAVLGPTVARSLWIMLGAVGLVLLIACANVANLFLVRLESRRRESAIRGALGAAKAQMAVHYLAESLTLSVTAGIAGVIVARWAVPAILAVAPRSLPRFSSIHFHWSAAALGIGLAVISGIVFGLVPLFRKPVDVEALRDGGRGQTGSRGQRATRDVLVVAQVALAVVLLAGAGLLLRSFERLRGVQPGLSPTGVLTFQVDLPVDRYLQETASLDFYHRLEDRISALPEVTEVGAVLQLPLRDFVGGCTAVAPAVANSSGDTPHACVATPVFLPGFFKSLGIEVKGREPTWADIGGRTQASVITKALADRLWPGENPIGKQIVIGGHYKGQVGNYTITGVIPELRAAGLDQPPVEAIFSPGTSLQPLPTQNGNLLSMTVTVRTTRDDPVSLVPTVRDILSSMDRQVPLVNPISMATVEARSMSRTSFIMVLLIIASCMALLLSAVGMYGVISYVVTQQRPEIGIRMALGAQVSQVGRLVMMRSVRLALAGAVLGVLGALLTGRLMTSFLFDISPADPLVLVLVPLALIAVALAASLAPARRAAKIDPVEAMRA
jgi:predicted permease